jgi:NDP-sugar pyrophosphorylase family protein
MRSQRITVQPYEGQWHNIGTPQQLEALNAAASAK